MWWDLVEASQQLQVPKWARGPPQMLLHFRLPIGVHDFLFPRGGLLIVVPGMILFNSGRSFLGAHYYVLRLLEPWIEIRKNDMVVMIYKKIMTVQL